MNSSQHLLFCAFALLTPNCEPSSKGSVPAFPDGGLLRTGTPLTRAQLYGFEGMYRVSAGRDLLGHQVAVRTSKGTVSLLTDRHHGFSVLGAACLPDRRVVIEGYWQYPTELEAGLVRLFVQPAEAAGALCEGRTPPEHAPLSLSGVYGEDDAFPTRPLALTWARAPKPWRGVFFNTAHHGACEVTDHCGVSPNSLESVRLAERVGSNAAELDVRVTRDGVPVMFHDAGLSQSLVRGLFCNGKLAELSLAELRGSCEYRYGEKIPTLREMLDMIVNDTELELVYLDIKAAGAVLPAAHEIAQLEQELAFRNENDDPGDDRRLRVAIAITSEEVRAAWHAAEAALEREGVLVPACLLEYDPNLVLAEGCIAWGPTWTAGSQAEAVQMLREHGVLTLFWTINQPDFIDDFLTEAKPNGIITARASTLFYRYQTIGSVPPPLDGAP
jgi:glycerophosphoryl diester phosphodiesterase